MTGIVDDRHTFYVGWVCGLARLHGLPFEPIPDAAGIYTDRLRLIVADGPDIEIVVPYPPEGWTMADPVARNG